MKSYKQQINLAARSSSVLKEPSPEEASALKSCLLNIFEAVIDLCSRHGLTYMLSGGSCLGAVRHHGFIPWDDDLDIMMPREDYQQLLSLLDKGALQTNYSFLYPDGMQDAPTSFLKIYRNNTRLVGLSDGDRFPQKVCIDVFPIDGVPSNRFVRRMKALIADGLRFAANTIYDFHPWSELEKEFYSSDPALLRTIKLRRFIGRIFSFIPHKKWVYWFDMFVSNRNMNGFVTIASGRNRYCGEVLPSSVFSPTAKVLFEEVLVSIPGEWEIYLKNLYGGDYMVPAPERLRERHLYSKIIIEDSI